MDYQQKKQQERDRFRNKYQNDPEFRARKQEKNREYARLNKEKIKEYAKEYLRIHGVKYRYKYENTPERLAQKRLAQARFRKTEKGRAARAKEKQTAAFKERRVLKTAEWRLRNKDKNRAHYLVGYALKQGKILKCPCEFCGEKNVVAHHDDYSKPLDVRWLCRKHHNEVHCTPRSKEELDKMK